MGPQASHLSFLIRSRRPQGGQDWAFKGRNWGREESRRRPHLPGSQAVVAEKVPARLDPHVFVPLGADLAKFECGVHGLVELQLLLGDRVGLNGWGREAWRKVPNICAGLNSVPSPRLSRG